LLVSYLGENDLAYDVLPEIVAWLKWFIQRHTSKLLAVIYLNLIF